MLLSYYTVLLSDNDVIIGSFPIHNFVLHYRTIIIIYNFITSLVPCCYYFLFNLLRFYLRRWRRRDLDYFQIIVRLLRLFLGLTIGHNHTGSVLPHGATTIASLHSVILVLLGQKDHLFELIVVLLVVLLLLVLRVPAQHFL